MFFATIGDRLAGNIQPAGDFRSYAPLRVSSVVNFQTIDQGAVVVVVVLSKRDKRKPE
jgi:hypothetical protein